MALAGYCAEEEWMDAFHIILECIFFNLSISVRACVFAFLCLRALVWRLISNDVGKPLRVCAQFQAKRARVSTRWWTLGKMKQLMSWNTWDFQWNIPTDSRLPFWPRPYCVFVRGSFLTPNVYDVRTWATTRCCWASPLSVFPTWVSCPSQSDGGGWSKCKHVRIGVFCLTGEVNCSGAGSLSRGNSSRLTQGLSTRHDSALVLFGSWLPRGQVSFDTHSLMTKLPPWLKVHTQEFTKRHQEAKNWMFMPEAVKRRPTFSIDV